MLRVTRNLYFGKANPSWIIDEMDATYILNYISPRRSGISTSFGVAARGFQSMTVEILSDTKVSKYDLPKQFVVFDGHAEDNSMSRGILIRINKIIDEMDPPPAGACRPPIMYNYQVMEETGSDTMTRVTKNLYYGRDNPSWTLYGKKARSLLSYISYNTRGINKNFQIEAPGHRSLTVEIVDKDAADKYILPRSFRVFDGHAFDNKVSQKILNRITEIIGKEFFSTNTDLPRAEKECGSLLQYMTWDSKLWDTNEYSFVRDTTHGSTINLATYSPYPWNQGYPPGNNCYSYACNQVLMHTSQTRWPQPGIGRTRKPPLNNTDLERGLAADGIVRLEYGMQPVKGDDTFPAWIVALATGFPDRGSGRAWDYHFFRKVTSGYGAHFWAHKPGASRVIHVARHSDLFITDPESEARKYGYDNFLGYFAVHNASICTPC